MKAADAPERSPAPGPATAPGRLRFALAGPGRRHRLELGGEVPAAELAYRTWGRPGRGRTVLVCPPLTADSRACRDPGDDRPGWWESVVGPGRPIDPARDFVVCPALLGGCGGSSGPASIDPDTGEPWGDRFPAVTIGDSVAAQAALLDHLAPGEPLTVIGGSIGGFQALEWVLRHPDRVAEAIVLAAGTGLRADALAWNELGRAILELDAGGERGLALARALAHLTYRTGAALDARFGRRRESGDRAAGPDRFAVTAYLEARGASFVRRFDASSYRRLLDAMDRYDAAADPLVLRARLTRFRGRLLLVGFDGDRLFPPDQTLELARHARAARLDPAVAILESIDGHDAFLLPHEALDAVLRDFLDGSGGSPPSPLRARGGPPASAGAAASPQASPAASPRASPEVDGANGT